MKFFLKLSAGGLLLLYALTVQAFDHDYKAWTQLLRQHVRVLDQGAVTQVDYQGLSQARNGNPP
jgi:hypothetical protein